MAKLALNARKIDNPTTLKTGALVLPVFEDLAMSATVSSLDETLGGAVQRDFKLGDFTGKVGSTHWMTGNDKAERVLLIGAGSKDKQTVAAMRKTLTAAAKALAGVKATDATVVLNDLTLGDDAERFVEELAREVTMALYRYTETLSKKVSLPTLKKLTVAIGSNLSAAKAKSALDIGHAIGEGANFARQLGNLPGNVCTPRYLSQQARKFAKQFTKVKTTICDEKKMAEMGMGSLLSVGNGSDEPSQLITMEYRGGKAKDKPYALVGKGITFDTGGISLKPGLKMDEMKFDMGGAASVFGTIHAIAALELPINVVGVVAAAENMPSGRATKPGDVVKSMSGKTIEILNTDAEGRLVLCDALTYVGKFKPEEVVDIATLTGAIIVTLGAQASGIFSNDDNLAKTLEEAGEATFDRGWRLPIWDEYQPMLESKFADVANIGTGGAASITAACFLARFTEEYKWAHLDVAGTSFSSAPKGASGRPVPMLVEYLRRRAGQ